MRSTDLDKLPPVAGSYAPQLRALNVHGYTNDRGPYDNPDTGITPRRKIFCALFVLFVTTLAISLGLGLGLGLRKSAATGSVSILGFTALAGVTVAEFNAPATRAQFTVDLSLAFNVKLADVAIVSVSDYQYDDGSGRRLAVAQAAGVLYSVVSTLSNQNAIEAIMRRLCRSGIADYISIACIVGAPSISASPTPTAVLASSPSVSPPATILYYVDTYAGPNSTRCAADDYGVCHEGTEELEGDGWAAPEAGFYGPHGLAFDKNGNLIVADTDNYKVRIVAAAEPHIVTTFAGTSGIDDSGDTGDGGPATSSLFNSPFDVAIDGDGNVFISDMENHHVRKVAAGDGTITTMAGPSSTVCAASFCPRGYLGDGGPATSALFLSPAGIAFDADNNLFIADSENHRVRKVASSDTTVTTVAGPPDTSCQNNIITELQCPSGFTGDGGPATSARFYKPANIALDGSGNLYIVSATHSVRKVSNGIVSTIAGPSASDCDGTAAIFLACPSGYSGDGGPATLARFNNPSFIAFQNGKIIISDAGNSRIRLVAADGTISTLAGPSSTECEDNGGVCPSGYDGDGGPATAARFDSPQGIALGSDGRLYVSDADNYHIRRLPAISDA